MTNRNQRQVTVPRQLKDRVIDYAWDQHKSTSAVVRELVERYADRLIDVQPRRVEVDMVTIRPTIPQDVWRRAGARAREEGHDLTDVIRQMLESTLPVLPPK